MDADTWRRVKVVHNGLQLLLEAFDTSFMNAAVHQAHDLYGASLELLDNVPQASLFRIFMVMVLPSSVVTVTFFLVPQLSAFIPQFHTATGPIL